MNEWMNKWINEWMNEWMNKWMNEWMNDGMLWKAYFRGGGGWLIPSEKLMIYLFSKHSIEINK